MDNDTKLVKEILKIRPTYFLKLSSDFKNVFPKLNSKKFKNSNALFAIALSKRKYIYKHQFTLPRSISFPTKKITFYFYLLRL